MYKGWFSSGLNLILSFSALLSLDDSGNVCPIFGMSYILG
jgi:hypothetical protein